MNRLECRVIRLECGVGRNGWRLYAGVELRTGPMKHCSPS